MASRVTTEGGGQRLRVLMLSHYFAERRGGVELVAAALARGMASPHVFVTWLATGTPDETAEPKNRRIDYFLSFDPPGLPTGAVSFSWKSL